MNKSLSKLKRYLEKIFCYTLVCVITPCFFIFEMSIVRPIIAKIYNFGTLNYALHTIFPMFLFINIVGNMAMCILTDTNVKQSSAGTYCESCKKERPEKAWHCAICNICILRRDHHCFFLSRCIGLKNLRYFVLYLGYIFMSLVYATYYNFLYVASKFEDDMYLTIFRVINPFLRYMIPEAMSVKDLYVYFLLLNFGLVFWTGALFSFHITNVLYGVTSRESKGKKTLDWRNKRFNLLQAFGERWYFAVICPFIDSPLPSSY